MTRDTCHGRGEVLIDHDGNVVARLAGAMLLAPCPDCIGGISSCCDTAGEAQPSKEMIDAIRQSVG